MNDEVLGLIIPILGIKDKILCIMVMVNVTL